MIPTEPEAQLADILAFQAADHAAARDMIGHGHECETFCNEWPCAEWPRNAAIEAELVRLTLGGRGPARPELRVDLLGKVYQAARAFADLMGTTWLEGARALYWAGIPVVTDPTLEPGTFRLDRRPPRTP